MLEAAINATEFAGTDRREFDGSKLRQYATVRALTILGEAAKVVSPETRERFPDFPWREMAGMRNILVHEYFGVESKIVWSVVTVELGPVIEQLPAIIRDVEERGRDGHGDAG